MKDLAETKLHFIERKTLKKHPSIKDPPSNKHPTF